MTDRLTPNDLETWRRHLREDRDGEFDTTLAHQLVAKLMVEVEVLWRERARTKAEALGQAATALEERLRDLGRRGPPSAPGYGCVYCRDAEARSFITYLRGMVATAKPRG
jgi:hypothetical protein